MGALHDGHASLVRRARDNGDVVVLTVFREPPAVLRRRATWRGIRTRPRPMWNWPAPVEWTPWSLRVSRRCGRIIPPTRSLRSRCAHLGDVLEGVGSSGSLRRGGERRGQAVRDERSVSGLLRREGLSTTRGRATDGARPVLRRRGGGVRRRSVSRADWPCRVATRDLAPADENARRRSFVHLGRRARRRHRPVSVAPS